MKKIVRAIVVMTVMMLFVGCSQTSTEADYPAAIMVDNLIYLLPIQSSPLVIDNRDITGYTDSYTTTFPQHNGETNFNRELGMPYAIVEGGIAVLYDNEWYVCTLMK